MQKICLFLSALLFFNTSLFSMQLMRTTKKTPHHVKIPHKNHSISHRSKTDVAKDSTGYTKTQPTTIAYKGRSYTPTEFALHVGMQGLAKGVDKIKECTDRSDLKVNCTCRLPYECIKQVDIPYARIFSDYDEARDRLKNAIKYLNAHQATPKEVVALQETLCPNSEICYKKARTQTRYWLYKKPVLLFFASSAASTVMPPLTAIIPLLTGIYLAIALLARSEMHPRFLLSPNEETSLRYMHEETKKINLVLGQIEPLIVQCSQKSKNPDHFYLSQQKKD